jgi:ABC-type Fe3+-hydroxamate transport system substrate-binding protein
VFDLGRGSDLVGVTRFCVHPADGVAGIEKVGGTKNPRIDRIAALEPDLVLLNEEENRVEDAEALRDLSVPCHVSFPKTLPQTAEMVRSIGAAIGREPAAERIAETIERRAARVARAAGERDPVRYAYLIWRDPVMAAGDDTFISELLRVAGGSNVFGPGRAPGDEDRYPVVGVGGLAAADPEAVLLSTEPFPFHSRHADELTEATRIDRSRFRIVDGELLSWHGSRTPRGIDYAETVINEIRANRESNDE